MFPLDRSHVWNRSRWAHVTSSSCHWDIGSLARQPIDFRRVKNKMRFRNSFINRLGRAIAQAFSHRLFTAEDQFHTQVSSLYVRFVVDKLSLEQGFYQVLLFYPVPSFTAAKYVGLVMHLGDIQRPVSGPVPCKYSTNPLKQ
jgi:hypothetical protein